MGNQQVSLEKRKLQRLSCDGSTLQAIGSGSGGHLILIDNGQLRIDNLIEVMI